MKKFLSSVFVCFLAVVASAAAASSPVNVEGDMVVKGDHVSQTVQSGSNEDSNTIFIL